MDARIKQLKASIAFLLVSLLMLATTLAPRKVMDYVKTQVYDVMRRVTSDVKGGE